MRKFLVGGSLAAVLLVGCWATSAATAPTNFAGTWALDKAKSKELPPQWDNIESYTLTVTQDGLQLTTDTKIARKERAEGQGGPARGPPPGAGAPAGSPPAAGGPPPGMGGGGGGGRRGGGMGMGMGMMGGPQTYKLDGSETTLDTGRGSATVKAEWQNGGKSLKLTTKRTFNFQGEDRTMTTTETWELSADGKTLTIQRNSETPQGPRTSTLVFNKQ